MAYKTTESIIIIQAEAVKPITTNVVFWSHDRGTAKLRFKLMKDNIPQSLPEGTTVPIRLLFKSATAEGGYGKHDYLATIEDRLNGIVSIVLQDNILGYQGRVEGSIYIDFPNGSLDTAGRFSFAIKRSPIDDTTPELEDYYFNGFSQIIDKMEKMISGAKMQLDAEIKDIQTSLDEAETSLATMNESVASLEGKIAEADQHFVNKESVEAGPLIFKNKLITTQNWNDLTRSGIYRCSAAIGANRPTNDVLLGYLTVTNGGGSVLQRYELSTTVYTRTLSGGSWSIWNKSAFASEVVNLSDDQEVGGTKNFTGNLQSKGLPVAVERSASKKVMTTNTTEFTEDSYVLFQRKDDSVVANFFTKNKNANFGGWKNLMPFPDGFHPSDIKSWGGPLTNKTARNPALTVYASASGIKVMAPTSTLPAGQECCGTISYFTNDDWPEDLDKKK